MSRYPWRDTSTDIAGGQPPQWETPQGAQVKVDTGLEDFAAMPETGLADESITTPKIRDGNVVESKIADQAVTQAKIAPAAITTEKLALDSIDTAKLKNDSVTTSKIKDDSVVTNKIKDESVTLSKLSSETIDAANHTYTGAVAASTVKGAIDATSSRVEYFITHSGDSVVEIVDARIPATGDPFDKLGLRLNNTDAQLAEKAQHTDVVSIQEDLALKDYKGYGEIFLPSDFPVNLPFGLYRDFDGLVRHTWDFSQFEIGATITLYCNSNTGSDGNTGAADSPFASLAKAMQTAAAASESNILIRITGKMLKDASLSSAVTITNKTVTIVPDTGESKITLSGGVSSQYPFTQKIAWTVDGGAYKATRTNAYNVFDMGKRDVYGVATPLEWASTLAACQSTLGTWYTDGASVWVNVGGAPTADILIGVNTPTFDVSLVNATLYIRDVEFYSGSYQLNTGHSCNISGDINSRVILNKCIFAGGEARGEDGINGRVTNGLNISNVGKTFSFECVGAYTRRDAFNYHYSGIPTESRRQCLVFEYRCIAYKAGRYDVNVNNNATTAHEGVTVLRVAGIGYRCKGPLCADVNGCYTVVIDGSYYDSTSNPSWDTCAGYYFDNSGATILGKAYLINCEGGSPKYALSGESNFEVHVRNFVGKGLKNDLSFSYLA